MLNTVKFYGSTSVVVGHYIDEHSVIRWRANDNKRITTPATHHKPLLGFKVVLSNNVRLSLYISGPEYLVVPRVHVNALAKARDDGVISDTPLQEVIDYANTQLEPNADVVELYSKLSQADISAIATARRLAILNRYNEILASGVHQDTKHSRESAAIEQVAIQCALSDRTVSNVLKYFNVKYVPTAKDIASTTPKVDKKSPEYKMLRYQRTLADNKAIQLDLPSKMKQENLLINGELPLICPVLRIRLNYIDKDNTHSVRVWYKYPGKGLVDDNYCVMSKGAVDLISGKRLSPKRRDTILSGDGGERHALWRAWCEKYGMEP